jgi:hypothetical protein
MEAVSDHTDGLPPLVLPQHNLTRYLRVRLEVAGGLLRVAAPRTLLGLVSLGVRRLEIPIADVVVLNVGRRVRPLRLLIGIACIVVPSVLAPWWVILPMVIAGLWVILVSLGPQLEVVTASGRRHRAGVCFSHQIDGELFAGAVNQLAAQAP